MKVRVESSRELNAVDQQWTGTLRNNVAAIAVYKVAHLVFFFFFEIRKFWFLLRRWRLVPFTFIDLFAIDPKLYLDKNVKNLDALRKNS